LIKEFISFIEFLSQVYHHIKIQKPLILNIVIETNIDTKS